MSSSTHTLYNKALGAYLGLACGDALGATVEFMTPKAIQKKYGVHKEIIGDGWLHLNKGDVTDDTQMSLALGQALIESQAWDIHNIAAHFIQWLESNPPDIGNTCLRGLQRYQLTKKLNGPISEFDAGNGACMRILPVILATLGRDAMYQEWVLEQNHITHHNPVSDLATISTGAMVKHLIRGQQTRVKDDIAHLLQSNPLFNYKPYPRKTSPYIVDTLQTVLYFFETTDSFEDCLINTVNMGGDADTTGAIVGMLAGAKYGVDAIPKRWLTALNPLVYEQIVAQTKALLQLADNLVQDGAQDGRIS